MYVCMYVCMHACSMNVCMYHVSFQGLLFNTF